MTAKSEAPSRKLVNPNSQVTFSPIIAASAAEAVDGLARHRRAKRSQADRGGEGDERQVAADARRPGAGGPRRAPGRARCPAQLGSGCQRTV